MGIFRTSHPIFLLYFLLARTQERMNPPIPRRSVLVPQGMSDLTPRLKMEPVTMNICQRCHAINDVLESICRRCGSTLLPPFIPETMRDDVEVLLNDENPVGRISTLETDLRNSVRSLDSLAIHLGKQSLNHLHLLVTVRKLVKQLEAAGLVKGRDLRRNVRRELRGHIFGLRQRQYLESRLRTIGSECRGRGSARITDLLRQAQPLLYSSHHREGISLLKKALQLQPANLELMRILAEIHFIAGNHEEAGRLLNRMLERNPSDAPAKLLLTMVHMKGGQFEEAMSCIQKVDGQEAEGFTTQFLLGTLHFLLRDFRSSGSRFRAAYHLRPLPQVSLLGSMAFLLGEDPGKAHSMSREAKVQLNQNAFYHFLAGLIHTSRQEESRAQNHFQTASLKDPRYEKLIRHQASLSPEEATRLHSRIFAARLRQVMESLMTVLIAEIQTMENRKYPEGINP